MFQQFRSWRSDTRGGPSLGFRMDYTNYPALMIQYNRLYKRNLLPGERVDLQLAFTSDAPGHDV
jgi:hypothetical protein